MPKLFCVAFFSLLTFVSFSQYIGLKVGGNIIPHTFKGDERVFRNAKTLGYNFEICVGFPWEKVYPLSVETGLSMKRYSIGIGLIHQTTGFAETPGVVAVPFRLVYNKGGDGLNFDALLGTSLNVALQSFRGTERQSTFYTADQMSKSLVFPLLEAGLRLNYTILRRVTVKFGLSQHFGFINILESNVVHTDKDGSVSKATFTSKGGYREISFGLVYSFRRKPGQ